MEDGITLTKGAISSSSTLTKTSVYRIGVTGTGRIQDTQKVDITIYQGAYTEVTNS